MRRTGLSLFSWVRHAAAGSPPWPKLYENVPGRASAASRTKSQAVAAATIERRIPATGSGRSSGTGDGDRPAAEHAALAEIFTLPTIASRTARFRSQAASFRP